MTLPWCLVAGLAFLVLLQARIVAMQRRSLKEAWERVSYFREEVAKADALMTAISREKVAEKGTAR